MHGFNFKDRINTETWKPRPLTWSEEDSIRVLMPHYDPIVITASVGMWNMERILVDEGSAASVIFANCYEKMNIPADLILEEHNPVFGFNGQKARPIGRVVLNVARMGKVFTVDFLLIDAKSPYNAILGRDWTIPMEVSA